MQLQKLQLAVITEYPYRSEMLEYLASGKGWKFLSTTGQADPIATLRNQTPDLVIVDLEMPNALTLLDELTRTLPNVPPLALITDEHLDRWHDAHRAGALDFVTFPVKPQHFFTTIDRVCQHFFATLERMKHAYAIPPANTMARQVIAVAGLKGGVGRSTLAANLAVALRQCQTEEVILSEAHHGLGQLALMLNLHPRYTVANLASESNIDVDLLRGYLLAHPSGIRLLAAPGDLTQVAELPEEVWQRTLTLLSELAPYVVVDTTATADNVLSRVLTQANQILLLVEPSVASLYSARALIETLRNEREIQGQVHVVLNQADRSGGLGAAVIEKHLGEPIYLSLPFDPSLVTFTMNRGVPFLISHPRALISRRVQHLADKLLKMASVQEGKTPPQKVPLFSSLLSVARR